ncbi:MAG: putative transrane protein [Polaromonas sp.]|nr:putative transrane protein [Polaromonas sp.]
MTITLSAGGTTVALDADLLWADENNWHPVEQSIERSVTGAQIISIGTRIGGRFITLQPEDDGSAWMTLLDVAQLKAWAAIAGQQMQLTLRGVTRTVIFRHPEPMEAAPVVHYSDVQDSDWYRLTLRFLEI